MNDSISNVLLTYPPRALTDGEQELLRGWASGVDDLAVYVSMRKSDDPAVYHRIVVSRRATRQRLYVIHTSESFDFWMVRSAGEGEDVGRFPTLRAALNFVRPVPETLPPG